MLRDNVNARRVRSASRAQAQLEKADTMPGLMRRCAKRFLVAVALVLNAGATSGAETVAHREDFEITARTAVYIVGLSLLGGIVSWISKVSTGKIPPWSVLHLVGELCTSAFSGFLAYLACDSAGLSIKVTMFLVGVAGHMGTRAIASFERFAEHRWGAGAAGNHEEPKS